TLYMPILLFLLMLFIGIATVHDSDPKFYISAAFAGFEWETIILIVVSANIISMEFEYGTIKHLITKYRNRYLIYDIKLLEIIIYDIYIHLLTLVFAIIIKLVIYGKRFSFFKPYLYHKTLLHNLVLGSVVDLLGSLLIIGIIFFLACISKSSSIAIASGIAMCFVGEGVSDMLIKNAGKLQILIKWNPFNMLNISNEWSNPGYFYNTHLVLRELVVGNIIYTVLFLVGGYILFKRKKV
ncbi:hypothetical protein, partial [Liquorilactobacillus ghanensis]|uniref:hypothetical protein n=1 Tax=Liquorilactobacillus ghanensis TaxID=399370 RepID=UPI0039E73BD2